MSFGKMNTRIQIIRTEETTDSEGFGVTEDVVIADVAAYREDRNSTERWANRAVFADVAALFRFRAIPNVSIDNRCVIISDSERFNITSVENVRRRNMYIEVLAKKEVQ